MKIPDWLADPTRKARSEISSRLAGRNDLPDSEYYNRFFRDTDISQDVVARVRKIFAIQLGEEFRLLYPDDDWTKEFQVIWQLDSMADVELVLALQEEFKIDISEKESVSMNCLRKVIQIINEKGA